MPLMCESHKGHKAIAVCHHCGRPLCELIDLSPQPLLDYTNAAKKYSLEGLCGYLLLYKTYNKDLRTPLIVSIFTWLRLLFKTLTKEPDRNPAKSCHCEDCLKADHPEMIPTLESLKAGLSYSKPRPV